MTVGPIIAEPLDEHRALTRAEREQAVESLLAMYRSEFCQRYTIGSGVNANVIGIARLRRSPNLP